MHQPGIIGYHREKTWPRFRACSVARKRLPGWIGYLAGNHWEMLRSILQLYQAITTVQLGDGHSTLLCTNVWIGEDSLADRFTRLFIHCTKKGGNSPQGPDF